MENKPILNVIFFFLFFDVFLYVVWYARKIGKVHIQTSAIEDKFIFTIAFGTLFKSIVYLGLYLHIREVYFLSLYYISDFSLIIVAMLLGIMTSQKYKEWKRKQVI